MVVRYDSYSSGQNGLECAVQRKLTLHQEEKKDALESGSMAGSQPSQARNRALPWGPQTTIYSSTGGTALQYSLSKMGASRASLLQALRPQRRPERTAGTTNSEAWLRSDQSCEKEQDALWAKMCENNVARVEVQGIFCSVPAKYGRNELQNGSQAVRECRSG